MTDEPDAAAAGCLLACAVGVFLIVFAGALIWATVLTAAKLFVAVVIVVLIVWAVSEWRRA